MDTTPIPAPGTADPKRPYKAYASAALAFAAAFVTFWVADADPFTSKDAGEALIAALIASGLLGAGTFAVKNPIVQTTGGTYRNEHGTTGTTILLILAVVGIVLLILLGVGELGGKG